MKKVKMDVLGRVNVPKSIRDSLSLKEGQDVYIDQVSDKVVITKDVMTKLCPVCNIPFTPEYNFCPYCGEQLQLRPEETN